VSHDQELARITQETIRHEIGNLVTIAQANVEAMIDGVVEPTAERLESVRDALQNAAERLKELAAVRKE
jgi:hypothetical protein